MKVLVTGAAGRLGSVVCKELLRRGHELVATDRRAPGAEAEAEARVRLELVDLRDSAAIYPFLRGQDALVHLGNIPSLRVGASPQAVLSDNTAINANVFQAARELGVRRIVFASSLQAMIRLDDGKPSAAPYTIPYFPLDGDAPTNPGRNYYGLSKEFGERMLRLLSEQEPERCCTSLRFPMLVGDWLRQRVQEPLPLSAINWGEALTYLELPDAAVLVALVLERQGAGYHQYFPAQALEVEGHSAAAVVARFYPGVPARRPGEAIQALVDRTALEQDLGFFPQPPLTVRLQEN